ncbi:MAG: HlyD family secretion protein, partial [Bradyrhizobium sp.]
VGARKVLITPDISGKIARIMVTEGQRIKANDELVEVDPQPFRIALTQAQARLTSVRTDFAILKSSLQSLTRMAELAEQNVNVKERDLERKKALVASRSGAQADVDNAAFALVTAQTLAQNAAQRRSDALNQLQSNPNLPIEQYPAFMQAAAALEQAKRDLDHTVLRAPIDGTATQVDNIQLGRYVTAGTPMFGIIDDSAPWVDANPKETDITHLKVGQPVMVVVDTFPDTEFYGTVASISPGTGAQFAIIPPQNASGNWVKVVQRVPVRIQLDHDEMAARLRAGMSAYVEIDTGRKRWFGSLFGATTAADETAKAAQETAKEPQ